MTPPSAKALGFFHPRVLQQFQIHQPLPLNKRESQKLLTALTDSFRQQLDNAHGFHPEREAASTSTTTSHPGTAVRSRRRSDASFRPTDNHLRRVLTNPLFNAPVMPNSLTGTRDPMDVFEYAVSKGMMTIGHAVGCLKEKRRQIIQSSVLSVREGIRESGAGYKVLRWLISSGIANDNRFLSNQAFATILIEFLVAEGHQEHIWSWIRREFHERIAGTSTGNAIPLMLLLMQEASGPQSLDAAIFSLLRAAEILDGQPLPLGRELLGNPGHRLVAEVHREHQPMSEKAFDSLETLIPFFSKTPGPLLAQLYIYHPSRPSADLALLYLAKMDPTKFTLHPKSLKSVEERLFVQLSLSTANFLLERNEGYDDSAWVLDRLQIYFTKTKGAADQKVAEREKSEASSLQLLEGLSFV